MISSICNELDNTKEANNGTIKYGVITTLVTMYSSAAPHMKISCHDIRNMMRKRSNSRTIVVTPPPLPVNDSESMTIVVTPRVNGGRLIGSTEERLVNFEMTIVAAKYEITTLYAEERDKVKGQKMRVKRDFLSKITSAVRKK